MKEMSQQNISKDSKIVIAIDPDVDKSGVCYYNMNSNNVEASSMTFPHLLEYLKYVAEKSKECNCNVRVVVEAGWLNKSHWHGAYGKGAAVSARIGNSTGRNHEVGRKIIECANHFGLETIEQRPLAKRWHGSEGKITQDELDMVMKGMNIPPLTTKVSQDVRDAVLIGIVYGERCF